MPFDAPQTFMQGLGFGASMARHADQNALARAEEARQAALLPMRIQQMQWSLKNAALDYSLQQEQMADMTAAKEGTIQLAQVMKGIDDYSDPLKVSKAYEVLSRNPAAMKTPLFQELNFRVRAAEHAQTLREIANVQATARREVADKMAQARMDAAEVTSSRMMDRQFKTYGPPQIKTIGNTTVLYREGAPGMHVITGGKLNPEDQTKLMDLKAEQRAARTQYNKAITESDAKALDAARFRKNRAESDLKDFFKKHPNTSVTDIEPGMNESGSDNGSQGGDDTLDKEEEDLLLGDGAPAAIPGQTPTSNPPVIEDPLGLFK